MLPVGVPDILQRVGFQDNHISQFAGGDWAEVLRDADDFCTVDGGGAQNLRRGHTAHGKAPHFPVIAKALQDLTSLYQKCVLKA